MKSFEVNLDSLAGPTHNYGGLATGNLASGRHKGETSQPREAALQSLKKMKQLADLGIKQLILPPPQRPDLQALRRLGFSGNDRQVVEKAWATAPEMLAACYSSSSMWAANAATVTPGSDSADKKVHFTPANLISNFHRSIEAETTARLLKTIFFDTAFFFHHDPLPATFAYSDEGAANHTRLCPSHKDKGIHLFVYGHNGEKKPDSSISPRQSLQASQQVARLHQLPDAQVIFARQNPEAIKQGVFHNDVISTGNENIFLYHQCAFENTAATLQDLHEKFTYLYNSELHTIEIKADELSLEDAVSCYLFNSQIITLPDGDMLLLAPEECQTHPAARAVIDKVITGNNPLNQLAFVDLRQSMHNGGGPACLRLRIVLTSDEFNSLPPGIILNNDNYPRLIEWVKKYYREKIHPNDLADPKLICESRDAIEALYAILNIEP